MMVEWGVTTALLFFGAVLRSALPGQPVAPKSNSAWERDESRVGRSDIGVILVIVSGIEVEVVVGCDRHDVVLWMPRHVQHLLMKKRR